MHQNQIAQGDVQPGNILFGLRDLDFTDGGVLMQNMTPRDPKDLLLEAGISEPVQRLDNEPDNWAPRYLTMNQPLTEFLHLESQFMVKISPPGPDQDIWSFDCFSLPISYKLPTFHNRGL